MQQRIVFVKKTIKMLKQYKLIALTLLYVENNKRINFVTIYIAMVHFSDFITL